MSNRSINLALHVMKDPAAMAEKTADIICRLTGHDAPCRTRETPLLPARAFYRS